MAGNEVESAALLVLLVIVKAGDKPTINTEQRPKSDLPGQELAKIWSAGFQASDVVRCSIGMCCAQPLNRKCVAVGILLLLSSSRECQIAGDHVAHFSNIVTKLADGGNHHNPQQSSTILNNTIVTFRESCSNHGLDLLCTTAQITAIAAIEMIMGDESHSNWHIRLYMFIVSVDIYIYVHKI